MQSFTILVKVDRKTYQLKSGCNSIKDLMKNLKKKDNNNLVNSFLQIMNWVYSKKASILKSVQL